MFNVLCIANVKQIKRFRSKLSYTCIWIICSTRWISFSFQNLNFRETFQEQILTAEIPDQTNLFTYEHFIRNLNFEFRMPVSSIHSFRHHQFSISEVCHAAKRMSLFRKSFFSLIFVEFWFIFWKWRYLGDFVCLSVSKIASSELRFKSFCFAPFITF